MFLPLYLSIMLLNCIKEAILWWFAAMIIILLFFALMGAVCVLIITGYRGVTIYNKRFGDGKSFMGGEGDQFWGGESE